MDQIRYIVQPEGDKFIVYRERVYDSGHNQKTFVKDFWLRDEADGFAEGLNRESEDGKE